MLIIVLAAYIIIGVYDLLPLYKDNTHKDFWVEVVLTVISLIAAVLIVLGIYIPSPEKPIREAITFILGK